MKRLLTALLLIYPLFSSAQASPHITFISKDSLDRILDKNWRFQEGDSAVFASPVYNDTLWEIADPGLYYLGNPKHDFDTFSSIAWLRLHFIADTSITNISLALVITHPGASEVYFDGRKIIAFGTINGRDSSRYYDPQWEPFTVVIPGAGEHILAVRYANYQAKRNNKVYQRNFAGFRMQINEARSLLKRIHTQAITITFVLILLFGIFTALSVIHLCLYLYYRAVRSNLYFSLFCLSLALLFFIVFINRFSADPATSLHNYFVYPVIIAGACCSLSGFINELFSRQKLRFRIITVLCLFVPVLWIIRNDYGFRGFVLLIGIVALEAIALTIVAIYKKIKGARIIGFGILFFSLFFLTIVILIISHASSVDNDSSTAGQLLELFGAFAILSLPGSMSVYLAWNYAYINKDLATQLKQVKFLSEKTLEQEQEKKRFLENRKDELEKEVALRTEEVTSQKQKIEKQHEDLKTEKKKSDDLLLNILPAEIAEELKNKGTSAAKFFDHVTVLFTDFADFTSAGERMGPQSLVDELHNCFKAFDGIISRYNIEKIKTIGDAYLAVCGLPVADSDHAINVVKAAIEIRDFMLSRKSQIGDKTFDIRIGIHSGSVVAGIVGVKKFAYDIWGDTVNTAARMEQHSEKGRVNISEVTYDMVRDRFMCTYRGEIEAKNKGALKMYFVEKEMP